MDFHTRNLRYFLAVADDLSFTRAAARLGISQPALSQRIHDLEKQIGLPLFARTGRGIELTASGEALVEPVRGLVGYGSRIERLIADLRVGRSRPLLIGASIYSEQPQRTELLSAFTEAYPQDPVELDTSYTVALFQGLIDGQFDIAVIVGPPPDTRFEWLALHWFPIDLIVPVDSPISAEKEISLSALGGTWIAGFRRKLYPQLYDKLIQPLANIGAHISYPPDQSPAGTLAYAVSHKMIIPTGFIQYKDDELKARGMVRRRLAIEPAVALMIVRARGVNAAHVNRFWEFARARAVDHLAG